MPWVFDEDDQLVLLAYWGSSLTVNERPLMAESRRPLTVNMQAGAYF